MVKQFPTLDSKTALNACRAPMLCIGSSHPRFDEVTLRRLQPHAWISRVAVSGHFVQVFALPQVIAMIDKFLEWLNTAARIAVDQLRIRRVRLVFFMQLSGSMTKNGAGLPLRWIRSPRRPTTSSWMLIRRL